MLEQVRHVTMATSSGPAWLTLMVHISAGLVGLVSGFVAIAAAKGGSLHRRSGIVFTIAMIVMGIFGAAIGAYEARMGSFFGGLMSAYLVFTGMTTVRPVAEDMRPVNYAMLIVGIALAIPQGFGGYVALQNPGAINDGVPAGMKIFMAAVFIMAVIGDVRMIRAGGALQGPQRLARHLWRMCFGLFIASGSFFLGQMKVRPPQLRVMPVLFALALAPLVVLLYWMWRVRLKRSLRGMHLRLQGNDA